ncbi:hypothetical protein F5X96DRAFT_653476 [Biscogniauxia mediterranea]|nr:hypothetical protein F5X96DRAFT_653476 [Biscogniauxia mediterranea]
MPGQQFKAQSHRRDTALPRSFKCASCNKWKPSSEFSLSQRAQWERMKRHMGDGVTPESIGLTCKEHLVSEAEIRCSGPCGKYRARSHFSKAQRNKPHPWCKACTDWKVRWPGHEAPDVAPDEEVPANELTGQITAYPGGSVLGIDDNRPDSDGSLGSCYSSDEDGTDDESDSEPSEYDRGTIRGDLDRGAITSIVSAFKSTVLDRGEDADDDDSDDNDDDDDEDALMTISTRSIDRASLVQSSITTKGSAKYKDKTTATLRMVPYDADDNATRKSRESTQASLSVEHTSRVPPHLWHLTSSGGIPGYTSNASQGIHPSRHSEARTNVPDSRGTLTEPTPSECTADTQPDLYNAAAFRPQERTFIRTTDTGSQNPEPTASTDGSVRDRGRHASFYKGDTRAAFYAPRPFAKRPIDQSGAPTTVLENPEYSGDSEDDF